MARYLMTGSQPIQIAGRSVPPGAGEIEAALDPVTERFFVGIGALKRVEELVRPRLRRREVEE